MEDQENNPVIQEIEKEIEDTKRKASDDDFEIIDKTLIHTITKDKVSLKY